MKSKRILCLLVVITLALVSIGCSSYRYGSKEMESGTELKTIGQLAYDVNKRNGYTLFLKENSQWIPYYVLTSDYYGHVLLLRQELIETIVPFNDDGSAYYADSMVDKYLNHSFIQTLSVDVQGIIIASEIEIAQKYPNTRQTEFITRKAFLLSCTETQIKTELCAKEGRTLDFFAESENRLATMNGQPCNWRLRSVYTADRGLVWTISATGMVGGSAVQLGAGIRPAICLDPSEPVNLVDIEDGKEGYVLDI